MQPYGFVSGAAAVERILERELRMTAEAFSIRLAELGYAEGTIALELERQFTFGEASKTIQ